MPRTRSDDSEVPEETPQDVVLQIVPVGPAAPAQVPTLDEAFVALCQAMSARLEENVPAQMHVEEIMGWHADGNHAVAWAHAILVLEQVLNVPLRG